MSVNLARSNSQVRSCWPVVVQLRPHLGEEAFVSAVRVQLKEGYRLAYVARRRKVLAVAGFRVLHSLAWGRFCYIDDLITDTKARSQGLGEELMAWISGFARSRGCGRLELDSGVQREGAHRFYFRQRMGISCYHFSMELGGKV